MHHSTVNETDALAIISSSVDCMDDPAPIAVVMPLHPPKFEYATHFLQSWEGCNQTRRFHWFPVFSSNADADAFAHVLRRGSSLPYHPLIVTPDRRNAVARKRLVGLRRVFQMGAYRFALGIDAESEFATSASLADRFAAWATRREVLVARLYNTSRCPTRMRIASASCAATAPAAGTSSSSSSSSSVAADGSHYAWWLDAPIYERDDFERFFAAFQWRRLSYYVFDHFAYLCWKLRERGWAARNITPHVDACRHGTDSSLSVGAQERIRTASFLWCAATAAGCLDAGGTTGRVGGAAGGVGPMRDGPVGTTSNRSTGRSRLRLLRYHLDRRHGGLARLQQRRRTREGACV